MKIDDTTAVTVQPNAFVTLHYRIGVRQPDQAFDMVDTFGEQPATLQLGQGQLSDHLERKLLGLAVGDKKKFRLSKEEAYGQHNPELVQAVSKSILKKHEDLNDPYAVDDFVHFPASNGAQFAGRLLRFDGDKVWFDFNHPLAGFDIEFEVDIIHIGQ